MTATTARTTTTGSRTPATVARWAGGLYLAYILASRIGNIGLSDAQTLRDTITGNETMFRWGLLAALTSALLFVLTAWALYTLLRPIDEPLALLLLVLNCVGVAVQCASYLPLLAVLAQADNAIDIQALSDPQLNTLALLSVTTYQVGFVTAQLIFAAWLFPLGLLVLRCGFLPRFLGWLLLLDGVAVLVSGSSKCSWPPDTPRSATRHGRSASSPNSASPSGSSSKEWGHAHNRRKRPC